MAVYTYQPLTISPSQQIRILTLLPGSDPDEIHCILRIADLKAAEDNRSYETLSYTWGPQLPSEHIHVLDEHSGNGVLPVGQNLYHALRTFRLAGDVRNLWIDAVCINQQDHAEKVTQIPLMRRIYEGSVQTLIWLGPSTPQSQSAMNLARALHKAWMECGGNVPKLGAFNSTQLKQHGLPSLFSRDYVNFLTMLEQDWFGRAWIVQEVTVSKKSIMYWGSATIEWTYLVTAIDFALHAELPFALHPAVNRFLPIAEEAEHYQAGTCRLLSALLRHRPCAATEPYDKVYAFLGLTEGVESAYIPLRIDYKQDLASCYVDVATKIAAHERSLDILSVAATPIRSEIEGLPSWAPDWSAAMGAKLRRVFKGECTSLANAEQAAMRKSKFTATKASVYTQRTSRAHNVLVVEGHLFDTITTVKLPYESIHISAGSRAEPAKLFSELGKTVGSFFHAKSVIMQWEDSIGLPNLPSNSPRYPTGEDLIDAFFQTLMVGNCNPDEDKLQFREEYLAWSRMQRPAPALRRFGLGHLQTVISAAGSLTASVVMRDAPAQFQKRVQDIIFRRFVQTSRGYMGVCSGDVKNGDQIWLCKGSKVPIVLRPAEGREGFVFLGDAYVHGIMYGNAFQEPMCSEIFLV